MAVLWVFTFFISREYSLTFKAFICITEFFLIICIFTDIDWQIIPDEASYSLIVIGILISPVNPILQFSPEKSFIGISAALMSSTIIRSIGNLYFGKESFGQGDIKLLMGIGSFLGWKGMLTTFCIASTSCALMILPLIYIGMISRKQAVPFGPFLCFSAILTTHLLVGSNNYSFFIN